VTDALTSGPSGLAIISRRSGPADLVLGCETDVTLMPSMFCSASARMTSPTLAPSGRSLPSSTPLGWRAPAARHVQVPSPRELVSSISSRTATVENLVGYRRGSVRQPRRFFPSQVGGGRGVDPRPDLLGDGAPGRLPPQLSEDGVEAEVDA